MTRCEMGPGEVRRSPIEARMSAPTAAPQLAVLRSKTQFIGDFLVRIVDRSASTQNLSFTLSLSRTFSEVLIFGLKDTLDPAEFHFMRYDWVASLSVKSVRHHLV